MRFEMTGGIEKGKVGGLFEDFLKEQGIYEETTEYAVKRVLAFQIAQVMKEQNITKVEMARRLDRLLDPDNDRVALGVLSRAARVLGRSLNLELR